jgi:predicted dinucleotide-binding enzyme
MARSFSTPPMGRTPSLRCKPLEKNLAGKVLLDLALPLDLSQGMPPTLTIANTDSLGEQIQRTFPDARVVKSLNTVFWQVMIDPSRVPGEHTIFVAGNDPEAKKTVEGLLADFCWPDGSILDLGDITGARGAEMYARLYFTLVGALDTFELNIQVIVDPTNLPPRPAPSQLS